MRFRNDVLTCTLSTLLAFERRARQSESLNLFQVSLLNTWMWITPIHRDVHSRNSLHSFQLFSAKCFYMFLLKEFRVFVLVARWWGNFCFCFWPKPQYHSALSSAQVVLYYFADSLFRRLYARLNELILVWFALFVFLREQLLQVAWTVDCLCFYCA